MRFASPEWLLLLLLLCVFFVFWVGRGKRQSQLLNKYFSKENQKRLGLSKSSKLYSHLYRFLWILLSIFFVLALARPQFGARKATRLTNEHSAVFMLDLSRSMLTRDISPSRLDLMKFEVVKSLKRLGGGMKVGLIAFAGSVDLISPLTEDLSAVEDYVNSLNTDSMAVQGTEIKTALDEAMGFFKRTSKSQDDEEFEKETKVIVLFSDGEDHQQATIDFVEKMSEKNYIIITVGVGTEEGGYVPESYRSNVYIKDVGGQPVLSKPNFDFLKKVAEAGRGSFFYLDPVHDLAPKLQKALDQLDKNKMSERDFIVKNEIYQVFLILGFMCLPLILLFGRLRG